METVSSDDARSIDPGCMTSAASAESNILSAGMTCTEPVGLRSSSLAHRRTSVDGDNDGSPTSGVLPTDARRESYRIVVGALRSTGHGGKHRDRVALANWRLEAVEEPYVLVVEVDVDETAQRPVFDQPVPQAGMPQLEIVD